MNLTEEEMSTIDGQVTFALYVCSKELIRRYSILLSDYDLTYTAYLVLLCLWKKDNLTVAELGNKLYLNSGTLSPLLKKMESQNLILREKNAADERKLFIKLTPKGKSLYRACKNFPKRLFECDFLPKEKVPQLLQSLHDIMENFIIFQ